MILLGLGSNVGDRLFYLRSAFERIKALPEMNCVKASPLYLSDALLPDNAPLDWHAPYLNLAITCQTNLDVYALLNRLKEIEWSIGRKPEKRHWGPREIDIDILVYHDLVLQNETLTIPHHDLLERPFVLWPLADLAPFWQYPLRGVDEGKTATELVEKWGSRFSGMAPFRTKQIPQRVDTPALVGIVNVTPDSFSDGGQCFNVESALERCQNHLQEGAEVIDIGAESTSPVATAITHEEEWRRLEPLFDLIKIKKNGFALPPKISIDTRHVKTAEKAILYDVDWINDVSGLDNPLMLNLVIESKVSCVIMHHLSIPERREHLIPSQEDVLSLVLAWGKKRIAECEKKGLSLDKIIFDPGIGFGKTSEQSLRLLKEIAAFQSLKTAVLVGYSRKSFLSLFSKEVSERDVETNAITLALINQPINYLRLHNISLASRSIKAFKAAEY